MRKSTLHELRVHDIFDFGVIQGSFGNTEFGVKLAHALTEDYVRHRLASGNSYLSNPDIEYLVGYVATIMELIDGYTELTEEARETLLTDAVGYIWGFIAYIDGLLTTRVRVDIYPALLPTQRRLALVV